MAIILITVFVATTVVLAFTIDPEVKRCEYCSGPITLKGLWTHLKKCPACPKSKEAGRPS